MSRDNGIKSYRDLLVWQKGMALVKEVYWVTRAFPVEERFGLSIQMRRAAVSVPSNIAEGQARQGKKEFVQFLSHAEGSLAELDTQLTLALELGYCRQSDGQRIATMIAELQNMIAALRRSLILRLSSDERSPVLATNH
jgi:four helix bundle protein